MSELLALGFGTREVRLECTLKKSFPDMQKILFDAGIKARINDFGKARKKL